MPIRCPAHPAPFPSEEYPPVVRRYVLSVVYRDGVPQEVDRFWSVASALAERDRRRDPRRRTSEHWMVHDSEDEERGYLEWDED